MKIKDLYKRKPVISLEIFPPKPDTPVKTIYDTIEALSEIKPDFISVTYGAGGSGRLYTVEIADIIKNRYNIEALAHITCGGSDAKKIEDLFKKLQDKNIENILALRGDRPVDADLNEAINSDYSYAKDLIAHAKSYGGFCIGAACYPEVHIECSDAISDLRNLKSKVDAGADFLISQLFLDNNFYYSFKEKLDILGLSVPLSAGIMPVINKKQISRITSLCGASIPMKFKKILDKYEDNPEALKEAGIAYAAEQIIDLLSSEVDGIHLYTMNRPEVAVKIISQISSIRKFFTQKNICSDFCDSQVV